MIDYETFLKIKHHHQHDGLNTGQIARMINCDERTVRRWLKQPRYLPRQCALRSSKLDVFKADICQWLEKYPYSAVQIFDRIKENGYQGGYTIVKDYVRKVRPRKTKAFLTLAFAPGECAQIDWGSAGSVVVGTTRRLLSFFAMVLCYSRMLYVEFTVSQSMEHFLACHINAFRYFGNRVPAKIMVDNLKSAVIRRITGHDPVLNAKYLDFANHFGFSIAPCGVGKPQEKGRVENAVGYIKKNFLAGLTISDFSVVNPAAVLWMDTVANIRVHGQTGKRPVDMFQQERDTMIPMNINAYDVATPDMVRASSQFRVPLDTNHYSVPALYAGARLMMKAYPDRICLYHQDRLIARHVRCYDRRQDVLDPDHCRQLVAQRQKAGQQQIFLRFLALSPKADAYWRQLEQRRMNPWHHIRKIVGLSEIYGTQSVTQAIDDAFALEAFSCEYIANLLEQRLRNPPQPAALQLTRRQDLLELSLDAADLTLYNIAAHPSKKEQPS
jgi:transposase